MKWIILLGLLLVCSRTFIFGQVFPQGKVDKMYQQELIKLKNNARIFNESKIEDIELFGIDFSYKSELLENKNFSDKPVFGKAVTLYVGPGYDTLLIDTNYTQYGDIIVYGNGILIVDSAQLTLYGRLSGHGKGQVILKNHAYLFVPQQFVSQYPQAFYDSSRFEAINSKIYANTCYRTFLYDNSEYICRHVDFPYWNFRQLYNHSKLIIEDARMVGDITINDSCEVSFINCDTILPWFGFGANDSLDIQFPGINTVNHYQFDSTTPGVKGINYSVTFDTCTTVVWGIESYPQSYVDIHNSIFCGTFRINGNDTLYFNKLRDNAFYTNLNVPFNDRIFTATNSYSQIWCIYTYDNIVLYMDSCEWGESHAKGNSIIYAENSVANGFPSCATSTESGFFYFTGGKCRAFVSAWNDGTTYIENSIVTPDRPGGSAQAQNFASDRSYILAVNSLFDNKPEALDTSLVMFVYIDSLNTINTDTNTSVQISGSAWLQAGLYNSTTFKQYKLYYQSVDSSSWIFINGATAPIDSNLLGSWNASVLTAGDYLIKLTIWDSNNDSLSALRKVTLSNTTSVTNKSTINNFNYSIYPNPTNNKITFETDSPLNPNDIISIYNIQGELLLRKSLKHAKTEIDISIFSPGIYVFIVNDYDLKTAIKFIKE